MPKNRKKVKVNDQFEQIVAPSKFRLGNRKSTLTAHQLSNDDLMKYTSGKDRVKAESVLRIRGVI